MKKLPVHLGDLTGPEGNAHCILGRCEEALKTFDARDEIRDFLDDATSGNYDHLLDTVLKYFDDLDGSVEDLREYLAELEEEGSL